MSDTHRVTWDSLTEDERELLKEIAQDDAVNKENERRGIIEHLSNLDLIGVRDGYMFDVYFLTWRGFRIIPSKVAAEIDREVMHE